MIFTMQNIYTLLQFITEDKMPVDQNNLTSIYSRLEKLEKQNRILRLLVLIGIVVVLGFGTIAWTSGFQTYHGQFIVHDKMGVMRGGWGYNADNRSELWIGRQGEDTGLSPDKDPDVINMKQAGDPFKTYTSIYLGYSTPQNPVMKFFDRNKNCRAQLGMDAKGNCNLWLYDERGKTVWQAMK